jgi:DNA-binding MarR family transcriptional regulator
VAEQRTRGSRRHLAPADPPPSDPSPRPTATEGPSAQLDTLIHERTRLGIISVLAANEKLSFVDLKAALQATDGNISAHTRKLEEAGYIVSHKRFEGRVPRTEYELTAAGRQALERYIEHMEGLIRSLRRR